jgi:hypothetical protein
VKDLDFELAMNIQYPRSNTDDELSDYGNMGKWSSKQVNGHKLFSTVSMELAGLG